VRILFATGRRYVPDRLVGGATNSAHELLTMLRERGHTCEAIAVIKPGARHETFRVLKRLSRRYRFGIPDRRNGYTTYRGPAKLITELMDERLAQFRPDLVFSQLEQCEDFALQAFAHDIPAILRFCDVSFGYYFSGRIVGRDFLAISNCRFVAARLRDRFGIPSAVIHSTIRPELYRAERREPECITFINPHKLKGLDLALEIAARLPRRKFLFQEGWPMTAEARADLERRLSTLPNVTLNRPTGDMRKVYGRTALLLVPSRCDDAFPRVIAEAHVNGIPVLGTRDGGIPESLGDGGEIFDLAAPPEAWVSTIERILSERALYADLSARARANVQRPEFDAEAGVDRFVEVAQRYVARRAGR
jgi:glycosyltransferase involved in cell wall biosynthesis